MKGRITYRMSTINDMEHQKSTLALVLVLTKWIVETNSLTITDKWVEMHHVLSGVAEVKMMV